MFPYKNVLVAIDFSESQNLIFNKIQVIREDDIKHKNHKTDFTFFHIVERSAPSIVGASQNEAISYNREWPLQEIKLKNDAMGELKKLVKKYKLGKVNCMVEVGVPKSSILFMAKRMKSDLIVVGAHGVHGFKKILGSTAQSIVNNASCDVLAVRKLNNLK